MKQLFSIMPNLQTHYHFKLDFHKWINIQEASGTKHSKDNQLQSLEIPCRIVQ